jgi:hypothetical protein
MNSNFTRITGKHLKGIHILLKFAIDQYKKQPVGSDGRNEWLTIKDRLADIQRHQFYNNDERDFLNKIRMLYFRTIKNK